ncbi:MAG: hypothetical protein U1F71_25195 [Verrucomicrobiaceae bacterium]
MAARPHTHEPLIFAWNARDHSTWHLVVALAVLMGAMAGFFFIFRIVHPVAQRVPSTPQHVIALDPADPAALALIHRAQDRSFALLGEAEDFVPLTGGLLAFHPSFEGHELKLRELASAADAIRRPGLFEPGSDVLPPVPRRAIEPVAEAPPATLRAVMSTSLAKRGAENVELAGIALTQPTRVQFRVAVGAEGQVITALPLSSVDDVVVMGQLQAAVNALRFRPSEVRRIEWGDISFRWEAQTP